MTALDIFMAVLLVVALAVFSPANSAEYTDEWDVVHAVLPIKATLMIDCMKQHREGITPIDRVCAEIGE